MPETWPRSPWQPVEMDALRCDRFLVAEQHRVSGPKVFATLLLVIRRAIGLIPLQPLVERNKFVSAQQEAQLTLQCFQDERPHFTQHPRSVPFSAMAGTGNHIVQTADFYGRTVHADFSFDDMAKAGDFIVGVTNHGPVGRSPLRVCHQGDVPEFGLTTRFQLEPETAVQFARLLFRNHFDRRSPEARIGGE